MRFWGRRTWSFAGLAAAIVSRTIFGGPAHRGPDIIARAGWIRIGLQSEIQRADILLPGPFRVLTPQGVVIENPSGGQFQATAIGNTVTVAGGLKALATDTVVTMEPLLGGAAGFFELPQGRYRGQLLLTAQNGTLNLVNQLQIDDWLKGVLPAEIGDAPPEALKAQAIAARSEAVHKLLVPPHANSGYDFCAKEHCQTYQGMKGETPQSNLACDSTLGTVLTVNGEVIDAVYHDVCGGVTAPAEDVWDSLPLPGLRAVRDTPNPPRGLDLSSDQAMESFLAATAPRYYCEPDQPAYPSYARKYYRWQKTLTGDQIAVIAGVGRVIDISVIERRSSGRVRKLQITGERGTRVIDKELPIRNAFDLWSGFFVLHVSKHGTYVDGATFSGAGHGHGVGLCQMGARSLAMAGASYEQILAHYYPSAKLQRIYRP